MNSKDIKRILICGAGRMGKNIGLVFASDPELKITMYDIVDKDVHSDIKISGAQLADAGVLSREDLESRLSRISFTSDIDSPDIAEADMVVESVYEDMALKRRTFAMLEERCREDAIFSTDTSVMSPSEISRDLIHRERFVGTHFWNPAHLIPLVEVVKSDATSDECAQAVMDILIAVGKKAVLCKKDVPGFIANRMQHALWREAISIVEQGIADAETVNDAVKHSFGLRLAELGPLENIDLVGIDTTYNIHNYLLGSLENSPSPSPLLAQLKDEGKLGFKTGEGFMKWSPEEIAKKSADLNAYLIGVLYGSRQN